MKKIFIFALCALGVWACSKKEQSATGLMFEENLAVVTDCCLDSTIPFKEYEQNFEEMLDSIALYVLSDEDADYRYQMRVIPCMAMTHIISHMTDSTERAAFLDRYEQRCKDILYTWYVQELTDSIENERFLIISMAAALDDAANPTRVGLSYYNSPTGQPLMIIGLPEGSSYEKPMIFFVPDNDEEEILFVLDDEMEIFTSKEEGDGQVFVLVQAPDLEQNMMRFKEFGIWFQNDGLTAVSVALKRFQEQYPAAMEWVME